MLHIIFFITFSPNYLIFILVLAVFPPIVALRVALPFLTPFTVTVNLEPDNLTDEIVAFLPDNLTSGSSVVAFDLFCAVIWKTTFVFLFLLTL